MCGIHPLSLQVCPWEAEQVAFILHSPLGMCLPRSWSSRALAEVVSPWQLWTHFPIMGIAQTETRFAWILFNVSLLNLCWGEVLAVHGSRGKKALTFRNCNRGPQRHRCAPFPTSVRFVNPKSLLGLGWWYNLVNAVGQRSCAFCNISPSGAFQSSLDSLKTSNKAF